MFDAKVVMSTAELLASVGPQSKPVRDAKFRSFTHAGGSIRRRAIESIKFSREGKRRVKETKARKGRKTLVSTRYRPSPAGTPPYHHQSPSKAFVRRGILFRADQDGVTIGPAKSKYGDSMFAHEHGGLFRGQRYPQRPFMQPALEANLDRFVDSWRGAVGK